MIGRTISFVIPVLLVLSGLSGAARADEAAELVAEAVKAAGGTDRLPKIFRWKETWELCIFYVREWPTRHNDLSASFFLSAAFCTGKAGRQKERGRKMNTDEVLANSRT